MCIRDSGWADNSHAGGGQFACPRCGAQYHAWLAWTSGRLKCSKVMVAQVDPDDRPLTMDGEIVLKAGQAVIYPL
eukprot:13333417-Alexandrium_andersonii.AAC.1